MAEEHEGKRTTTPTPEEVWTPPERESRFRISSRVVRDIPSLVEVMREELKAPELWVFRGQRDWEWALTPKTGRYSHPEEQFPLEDPGIEGHGLAGLLSANIWWMQDQAVFDNWKAEAVALVPPSLPRPSSNLEWLAIGQHHGLLTRLLDWTRNPLVGSYFAVKEQNPEQDSALFALRGLPALEPHYESDPWKVRGVRLWHPPSLVERIGRQSGLFTLHQAGDRGGSLDLVTYAEGAWYEDAKKRSLVLWDVHDLALVKIRIEASARAELRHELRLLGVDEFFAFPDLEGLCRAYKDGRIRQPTYFDLLPRGSI